MSAIQPDMLAPEVTRAIDEARARKRDLDMAAQHVANGTLRWADLGPFSVRWGRAAQTVATLAGPEVLQAIIDERPRIQTSPLRAAIESVADAERCAQSNTDPAVQPNRELVNQCSAQQDVVGGVGNADDPGACAVQPPNGDAPSRDRVRKEAAMGADGGLGSQLVVDNSRRAELQALRDKALQAARECEAIAVDAQALLDGIEGDPRVSEERAIETLRVQLDGVVIGAEVEPEPAGWWEDYCACADAGLFEPIRSVREPRRASRSEIEAMAEDAREVNR